jgi:hypothetical protein
MKYYVDNCNHFQLKSSTDFMLEVNTLFKCCEAELHGKVRKYVTFTECFRCWRGILRHPKIMDLENVTVTSKTRKNLSYIYYIFVTFIPIARQRVGKHIPAT